MPEEEQKIRNVAYNGSYEYSTTYNYNMSKEKCSAIFGVYTDTFKGLDTSSSFSPGLIDSCEIKVSWEPVRNYGSDRF